MADRAWAAAIQLVGTPYRMHGRTVEHGLDCVGVVALAYVRAGLCLRPLPDDYRLRGDAHARVAAWLEQNGFDRVGLDEQRHGDIMLSRAGHEHQHLLITSPGAHIHAHAALRRVVMTPGSVPGQLLGQWRLSAK